MTDEAASNRVPAPLRVGIIGAGAIGSQVAQSLRDGEVGGCTLGAILAIEAEPCAELVEDLPALLRHSDLVVEAAGHGALEQFGSAILEAGHDLLVVSAGALADDELRNRLWNVGPGRLSISSGAVGGLDTLRAATLVGDLDEVTIVTTKPSHVLIEPWMSDELRSSLQAGVGRVTAFDGPAREAVERFPTSVNIAATVSLATIGFDRTRVQVIGDPASTGVEHTVCATGAAGSYEFTFRNHPSAGNPRTSGIVPYAILRALQDVRARVIVGR